MSTALFCIVTVEQFEHGLRCIRCSRLIENGQPYGEAFNSLLSDGTPVEELVCVYCVGGRSDV